MTTNLIHFQDSQVPTSSILHNYIDIKKIKQRKKEREKRNVHASNCGVETTNRYASIVWKAPAVSVSNDPMNLWRSVGASI